MHSSRITTVGRLRCTIFFASLPFQLLSAQTTPLSATQPSQPAAQTPLTTLDFDTGGEYEDYLRVMQLTGASPLYPWSIRGLSPPVITQSASADSTGPWLLRRRFVSTRFAVGPVEMRAIANSSYPYGANDGPVWAGRGITLVGRGAIGGHLGAVSYSLSPKAFITTNGGFTLLANKQAGPVGFGNATYPGTIDYPQRFGNAAYGRVDLDATSLRLDARLLSVGVSTANEWIGPATEFPFILGTNAGGFPHVFIATGDPVNFWFARVHARVFWGRLYQSAYSPVQGSTRFLNAQQSGTVRLASSAQLVIVPRGIPGLELGFARFFHSPNRIGGPARDFWTKPFRAFFLKKELAEGDTLGADNQLASAYFRWVLPHSGLEIYGERGYEDQFYDLREFFQDPDHDREYMLGFQKTLTQSETSLNVLKAELINYQLPTIARVRYEGRIYLHSTLRQGHTNRGQLLGAYPGVGAAAGSVVSWTHYSKDGRTTFSLRRIVRGQSGDFVGSGIIATNGTDVIIAPGVDAMRFGKRFDLGWHIEPMADFNRNFENNVIPNLNVQLSARMHL